MIFMENKETLADKFKRLKKAFEAKQLSEREYELWKRVSQASTDTLESYQSSASQRKRRRVR